ncbi:MAG: hypothetical protein ABI743_01115, partial [bacterium]
PVAPVGGVAMSRRRLSLQHAGSVLLGCVFVLNSLVGWGIVPGTAAGDEVEVDPAIRHELNVWIAPDRFSGVSLIRGGGSVLRRKFSRISRIIVLSSIGDLRGIEFCRRLDTLIATGQPAELSYQPSLETAFMPGVISRLAGLPQLSEVQLSGQHIHEITPLATLPRLRILDLSLNPIADYSPLERLDTLTELKLGARTRRSYRQGDLPHRATDFAPIVRTDLRNLPRIKLPASLEALALPGMQLHSLDLLEGCTHLKSLDLGDTAITSIHPLLHCPELEVVWLDRNDIEDPDLLLQLSHLKAVVIDIDFEERNAVWLQALRARGVRVDTNYWRPTKAGAKETTP